MKYKIILILFFVISLYLHLNSVVFYRVDIDINDLCDLEGYTLVECDSVDGEFEGDYGEIIKLYNGMIFELEDSNYSYSYDPDIAIFAKIFKFEGKEHVFYKLVIEDDIYDCTRIR